VEAVTVKQRDTGRTRSLPRFGNLKGLLDMGSDEDDQL
jgi:hypothetical protein